MGLFGGSSSKSYSTTIMEDHRVIAEESEIMVGSGANVAVSYPGSVIVEQQAEVRDVEVLIQQYTPEVQRTVEQVVETFAESTKEVTETLGQKLLTTEQGVASILPEMAKYFAIAVVLIVVARKVWK